MDNYTVLVDYRVYGEGSLLDCVQLLHDLALQHRTFDYEIRGTIMSVSGCAGNKSFRKLLKGLDNGGRICYN